MSYVLAKGAKCIYLMHYSKLRYWKFWTHVSLHIHWKLTWVNTSCRCIKPPFHRVKLNYLYNRLKCGWWGSLRDTVPQWDMRWLRPLPPMRRSLETNGSLTSQPRSLCVVPRSGGQQRWTLPLDDWRKAMKMLWRTTTRNRFSSWMPWLRCWSENCQKEIVRRSWQCVPLMCTLVMSSPSSLQTRLTALKLLPGYRSCDTDGMTMREIVLPISVMPSSDIHMSTWVTHHVLWLLHWLTGTFISFFFFA